MLTRQFLVYLFVGMLTTIVDVGTLQTLLWLGYNITFSVTVAFALATVFNYVTHQRVTFRADHSFGTIVRYGILLGVNYTITLLCTHAGERYVDSALIGKLISLPIVTTIGFLCGKYWIFRHRH